MKKMRKIFVAAALLAVSAAAGAQTIHDAIEFSGNHYFGTARSMAMGNAVTALGGDLGSVGINPAGSAVSGYGQFVITPGLTVSSVGSAYSPEGESAYGVTNGLTRSRMNVPNFGLSMNFGTGRRSGLKTITLALVSNQTASYNFASEAFGTNSRTSKIAEFASAAAGIPESELANPDFYNGSYSWDILTAYNGGMFGPYGRDGVYAGVTEAISGDGSYRYLPGPLSQTSVRSRNGNKNDLLINLGLNFSDRVYVGFNVGMPSARYRYSESFYEAAVNPDQFVLEFEDSAYPTSFLRGSYNYQYTADIDGIYAKLGIIVRPIEGLRIGAAFQTPTALTISENWQYGAATAFDDNYYNDSYTSPVGEFSYLLRTPYRASFGAAYAFGDKGLVSVDYELADYSVMRFETLHYDRMNAADTFQAENWVNRNFAGISHALRVGAEYRLNPAFALRAGYSVTTSPERYWTDSEGATVDANLPKPEIDAYLNRIRNLVTPHYYGDRTQAVSFGFGYSSAGSFFADAVVRCTRYPSETFAPYYDYDSCDKDGQPLAIQAPRILSNRSLWNVAVTLGWRF